MTKELEDDNVVSNKQLHQAEWKVGAWDVQGPPM